MPYSGGPLHREGTAMNITSRAVATNVATVQAISVAFGRGDVPARHVLDTATLPAATGGEDPALS
jgi:hypothetical protein